MGQITDIGMRIELVSMDQHFEDISIALYEQQTEHGPRFLVKTYSQREGSDERMRFLVETMVCLGGMETTADPAGHLVWFPCGTRHFAAIRRVFLESCKIPTEQEPVPKPMKTFDKKADAEITVVSEGNGQYRVTAAESNEKVERRINAIAGGLVKLSEMEATDDNSMRFSCGHDHDVLVGLLLPRAINVRQAIREQEQSASKGVLAAPSQQE